MAKLARMLIVLSIVGALAGISIGNAQADAGHVVTIDDLTVDEGDGGLIVPVTVTAHVSPAPEAGERAKVDFGTSAQASQGATAKSTSAGDPTPTFPEDFAQSDGTLTFEASQTDATFTVPVLRDNADEMNETFFINLFNARGECVIPLTCTTGASIGDNKATVTLVNDDTPPVLAVNNVTHDEGDEGSTNYHFVVTKTGGSGKTVTVGYETADDTAAAASDYGAASGTLTFAPSDPLLPEMATATVVVSGDTAFEPDEVFKLNLEPMNATMEDAQADGTIANDDDAPPPSMSVANAGAGEGDDHNFVVSLSSPPGPGQTAIVNWASVPGEGAGVATEGTDYPASLGSLVFTAGESEQTITVPTTEDGRDESDETFTVNVVQPEQPGTGGYTYTIADASGTGTIADDDAAPSLAINDVSVDPEGHEGTKEATFTVTMTGTSDKTVTVHWATNDNSATSADYTSGSGDLSFAPDETTKQVVVTTKTDTLDEADETFKVNLSSAVNGTISDGQGVGTIKDDDTSNVTLAVGDLNVTEGNSGTTLANFAVTKTGATGLPVTVKYATADWTAKKGLDYTEVTGTLTFQPNETSKFVAVPVRGDTLDEINETYSVNLSLPTNATISDALGGGGIIDNDTAPSMSIGNDSVNESASEACTVLVKLSAASGREVNVNYTTASVTAGTADYVAKSGTVKFVPGDVAEQIKIFARADSKDEPTEKFTVKLSGISPAGSASFANTAGTCSIVDND
jgi:hypothetical protein